MNESLSGCDKLIGNVQGRMAIDIYLIGQTPACSDGPMCGHQPAAVRDEMHREPLFAVRLSLSPNVSSHQHFCSKMVYQPFIRPGPSSYMAKMKAASDAGVDRIQEKLICSTCKEEATDWTRLTTIVIWQVSAVHANYHLARYNPSPVHAPPVRSTTLRYIRSVRRCITRPT